MVAEPLLSQDLHCPCTSTVITPLLLQDIHCSGLPCLWTSNLHDVYRHSTSTVTGHTLSKHENWHKDHHCCRTSSVAALQCHKGLHCSSTYTVTGHPLPQQLDLCRTSIGTVCQLTQDLQYCSTSTVAGPPLSHHLHCLNTSCCRTAIVTGPPPSKDLY